MAFHNAFLYRGFTLDCEPVRRSDSCYVAKVIISREAGRVLDEYAFENLCALENEPSAAAYAKEWGRLWVDQHWRRSGQAAQQDE